MSNGDTCFDKTLFPYVLGSSGCDTEFYTLDYDSFSNNFLLGGSSLCSSLFQAGYTRSNTPSSLIIGLDYDTRKPKWSQEYILHSNTYQVQLVSHISVRQGGQKALTVFNNDNSLAPLTMAYIWTNTGSIISSFQELFNPFSISNGIALADQDDNFYFALSGFQGQWSMFSFGEYDNGTIDINYALIYLQMDLYM